MLMKCIALAGLAALLAACSSTPTAVAEHQPWNGGTWNSVLGYHGPTNAMAAPTAR